jgi:mono/diheme cytochrome c family protein
MSPRRHTPDAGRQRRRVANLSSLIAVLVLSGCSSIQRDPPLQVWPDMRLQPRFEAQGSTGLFPDGRQSRRRPDGVLARGHVDEMDVFNTGLMENGQYVGKMPIEVTEAVLTEGRWRFNTYCAPCHDQTALGRGMVPQRWPAWQPANLTEQRVVELADGDIFNVITYGRRTMPPYGPQNRAAERWAIIAYLRVLQRAAHGTVNDVPEELRSSLEYKGPPPGSEPAQPAPEQTPADGKAKQ